MLVGTPVLGQTGLHKLGEAWILRHDLPGPQRQVRWFPRCEGQMVFQPRKRVDPQICRQQDSQVREWWVPQVREWWVPQARG